MPHQAALAIIDMQSDFMDPQTRLFVPRAREIIPAINRLTAAARNAKRPVIWIIQQHRRQLVDFGRELDQSPVHCVEGTPGAELDPDIVVNQDDFFVIKRRYSGFYCTDLDLLVRSLDSDTLFIAGIATDGCVQATALDAHARDYHVRVIRDATAAFTDAGRDNALDAMAHMQPGVVIDHLDMIEQLNRLAS